MISADEAIEEMIETRLMTCCGESIEIEEPTDSAGMLKCYVCFGIGIGYEKAREQQKVSSHFCQSASFSMFTHTEITADMSNSCYLHEVQAPNPIANP